MIPPLTPPAPGATPFDTGNAILAEGPAALVTARIPTPAGQRLAVTVRTPSTTLTVFLSGPDAKAWASRLTAEAEGMSVSGLVAANGSLPPVTPA